MDMETEVVDDEKLMMTTGGEVFTLQVD